jgi:hypothetical protein
MYLAYQKYEHSCLNGNYRMVLMSFKSKRTLQGIKIYELNVRIVQYFLCHRQDSQRSWNDKMTFRPYMCLTGHDLWIFGYFPLEFILKYLPKWIIFTSGDPTHKILSVARMTSRLVRLSLTYLHLSGHNFPAANTLSHKHPSEVTTFRLIYGNYLLLCTITIFSDLTSLSPLEVMTFRMS